MPKLGLLYKISRLFISRLLIVAFLLLLFLSQTLTLYATSLSPASLKGLTLSTLRSELNIEPGISLEGTLKVTNSTEKTMAVTLSAEEFSVINQQYDYAFTKDSDVASWVTFDNAEINLEAGVSKDVKYILRAPLSAEPGGQYISLFASTMTQDDSTVSSQQRIASLLYINVIGDVTRSGKLVSLSSPWLVINNGNWSAAVQNTGTTHFRSRYNIQISNLFNDVVASSQSDDLILPSTVRLISGSLSLPKLPGLYRVTYTIGLGDTPAVIETRYMLYASPFVIAILGIIIFLVIIIFIFKHKILKKRQSV